MDLSEPLISRWTTRIRWDRERKSLAVWNRDSGAVETMDGGDELADAPREGPKGHDSIRDRQWEIEGKLAISHRWFAMARRRRKPVRGGRWW